MMDIGHLFHIHKIIKRGFFQAEDGIRDVERSRGLGDVYKRQVVNILVYICSI